MKLVCLKTFDSSLEAHLLGTKLEDEGIEYFLRDSNIINTNPIYANAVGGVKLDIKESDTDKALAVLRELDSDSKKICECPKCSSNNILYGVLPIKEPKSLIATFFSMLVALLTVTFPLFGKTTNRCNDCGEEFHAI